MFWSSFSSSKLKSHLSMSCERLRLAESKRRNKLKIERKEIAALLRDKKFDKARIKVESVIRETREGEAGEILELMCDLLVQRITLISNEKACPSDMQECVQTVIWAAPRSQCEEMRVVREQLILKYGEQWCAPAVRGEGEGCRVNEKIKARLTTSAPSDSMKLEYLKDIAKEAGLAINEKDLNDSAVGLPPLDPKVIEASKGDAAAIAAANAAVAAAAAAGAGGPGTTTIVLPPGSTVAPHFPPGGSGGPGSNNNGGGGGGGGLAVPTIANNAPPAGGIPIATALPAGVLYFDPATNLPIGVTTGPGGHGGGHMGGPGGGFAYPGQTGPSIHAGGVTVTPISAAGLQAMGYNPGAGGAGGAGANPAPFNPSSIPVAPVVVPAPGYSYGAGGGAGGGSPAGAAKPAAGAGSGADDDISRQKALSAASFAAHQAMDIARQAGINLGPNTTVTVLGAGGGDASVPGLPFNMPVAPGSGRPSLHQDVPQPHPQAKMSSPKPPSPAASSGRSASPAAAASDELLTAKGASARGGPATAVLPSGALSPSEPTAPSSTSTAGAHLLATSHGSMTKEGFAASAARESGGDSTNAPEHNEGGSGSNAGAGGAAASSSELPSLDALRARFAALKGGE